MSKQQSNSTPHPVPYQGIRKHNLNFPRLISLGLQMTLTTAAVGAMLAALFL
jgi:hypothetical protein